MSGISPLAGGLMSVMLRRITRTKSVEWPRWRLYVPLLVIATAAFAGAIVGVYTHPPTDELLISFLRPTVVIAVAAVPGIAVMVMELSRDRSGATVRALRCLPLRRREIAFLTSLPSLLVGFVVLAIPVALGITALMSVGTTAGPATGLVAAALGGGLLTVAVPYFACSFAMRGRRWDTARFPVALVMWGVLYAWQLVVAVRSAEPGQVSDVATWLPLALVLSEVLFGSLQASTLVVSSLLGVASAIAVAVDYAHFDPQTATPHVAWEWHGQSVFARYVGEFRYAFRDPSVRANAIVSLLVSLLLATAFYALPVAARPQLAAPIVALIGLFAAVTARSVRGIFAARLPPQRLIGMSPVSWALSTAAVVVTIVLLLLIPSYPIGVTEALAGRSAWFLPTVMAQAAAVAVALGALAPIAADNILGQALLTGITSAVFLGLTAVQDATFQGWSAPRVTVAALLLVAAVGVAVRVEMARWKPRITRSESRM